jgi:LacI family transcriptional regulator
MLRVQKIQWLGWRVEEGFFTPRNGTAMSRTAKSASKNLTILDVAREAGVSFGTVSRVLNEDKHVREETRERVQRAIGRLGFVANRHARILAGGKSGTVGVLVPDLGTEYIGEIMRGADAELALGGYGIILYTTHRNAKREAEYVAVCLQGMVDGLLLVLPRNPSDFVGSLIRRKFPFVFIDHQGFGKDSASVSAANWQGAYEATEYLIGLGHRRIGFITGWADLKAAQDRLKGYQAALRTNHISEDPGFIYEGTFSQPDGCQAGLKFLGLKNPPTAVFASNDMMAMGVMDAARERGLKVPDDLSVVGFDDIYLASQVRPAISTVRQPLEKMGRVAAQMLLEIIRNPGARKDNLELPTELVVRDSCRAINDAK